MITKELIIEDLREVKNLINQLPSNNDYEKFGKYSLRTVKRIFGKWSTALTESFNETRLPSDKLVMRQCTFCTTETKNPKFCSSSCAASFNNKYQNGRKVGRMPVLKKCICCNKNDTNSSSTRCQSCKGLIKTNTGIWVPLTLITKGEIATNDTQKHRRIRNHARSVARSHNLLSTCFECNYSIHVECAHRIAISSYPDSTLLITINDPKNLVGLCRNHHWEYDHGLLKLK